MPPLQKGLDSGLLLVYTEKHAVRLGREKGGE